MKVSVGLIGDKIVLKSFNSTINRINEHSKSTVSFESIKSVKLKNFICEPVCTNLNRSEEPTSY